LTLNALSVAQDPCAAGNIQLPYPGDCTDGTCLAYKGDFDKLLENRGEFCYEKRSADFCQDVFGQNVWANGFKWVKTNGDGFKVERCGDKEVNEVYLPGTCVRIRTCKSPKNKKNHCFKVHAYSVITCSINFECI
jgi:hypothetical protein